MNLEEQIKKCYKCSEEYCPVWSPFGEQIDTAISLKTFTNEFVKAWVSNMENEPIPCLTHDNK